MCTFENDGGIMVLENRSLSFFLRRIKILYYWLNKFLTYFESHSDFNYEYIEEIKTAKGKESAFTYLAVV